MQKGSIVAYVNDNFTAANISMFNKMPVKGELYMVREMVIIGTSNKRPGVRLEEIYGKVIFFRWNGASGYTEFHFKQDRFIEVLAPIEIKIGALKENIETIVI